VKRLVALARTIAIITALAAASAAFLLWQSTGDLSVAGCGAGSGCDAVLSSRWSRLGPIPIAAPALLIYIAMIVFATTASSYDQRRQLFSWRALLLLSILATGAALWFISLQLFVIGRFCIYCTITHLLALTASALVFLHWRRSTTTSATPLPLGPALAALILLSAMIATQLLYQPKLYTITTAPNPTIPPPTTRIVPSPTTTPTSTPSIPTTKTLHLFGGRATIDPANWPLLGSPRATNTIAMIFDYTCDHCRREHPILQQARQRYGDQLAIIAIPLPLDPSCNKAVTRPVPLHVNSCAYVRFALAVWKADPTKFERYHNFLMASPRPPPLPIARSYAEELVGTAPLANLPNPDIDSRIDDAVALFRAIGMGPIPKLILPNHLLAGETNTLDRFSTELERHLNLKPAN
jgi:uncharacterized membrane protein/protein-disulfide isomerase